MIFVVSSLGVLTRMQVLELGPRDCPALFFQQKVDWSEYDILEPHIYSLCWIFYVAFD